MKWSKVHERVRDRERKRGNDPDDVHRHGDGPLPGAFDRYPEDLPVSIVLGQDDQGWKKGTRGIDPEWDVLESGNHKRDMFLVWEVEVGKLARQPPAVETGDGKRISCQCRRPNDHKHRHEVVKAV
jgi:hypothetical protein